MASGPTGYPQPSRIAVSMSAAAAYPISRIRIASLTWGSSSASTRKPGRSGATTAGHSPTTARPIAIARSELQTVRTTSTSSPTVCSPITSAGRPEATAGGSTGPDPVLANTAFGAAAARPAQSVSSPAMTRSAVVTSATGAAPNQAGDSASTTAIRPTFCTTGGGAGSVTTGDPGASYV